MCSCGTRQLCATHKLIIDIIAAHSNPTTAPRCCLQDLRKLRRLTSSGTALLAGLNSSGKVVMPAHCCTAAQLLSVQQCNSCMPANLMTLLSMRKARAVGLVFYC